MVYLKTLLYLKQRISTPKNVEDIFTGDMLCLLAELDIVKRESKNDLSDYNIWNGRAYLPLLRLIALNKFLFYPSIASVERSFSFPNKILSDKCHIYNWKLLK